MSARTLRVLVSLLGVGIIFMYFASLQISDNLPVRIPDEGKPGAPLPGLTKKQLDKFYRCKAVFAKTFTTAEGLGPLFNEQSCASCHGGDSPGASAQNSADAATFIGKRDAKSKLMKDLAAAVREKIESADFDPMIASGGPVLIKKTIVEQFPAELQMASNCAVPSVPRAPAGAEFSSTRMAPTLYGMGLLEAVQEGELIWRSDVQKKNTKSAIKGKTNTPAVEIVGLSTTGKFGSKASEATLFSMCANELAIHMGISNPCNPHSYSANGVDNLPDCIKSATPADPNATGKLLAQLTYYVALLAPPLKSQEITPEMEQGSRVFHKLGCAECHVPELKTPEKVYLVDPDGPPLSFVESKGPGNHVSYEKVSDPQYLEIRALEQQAVPAYTDLLLHNMGKELADGIPQGTANGGQWRTAPLWGCKDKKSYLHDGRAHTLDAAITAHGGEAEASAKAYKALPQNVKDALSTFLKAL